jgi:glycosyltransferase involved in cell wall biosynthesis
VKILYFHQYFGTRAGSNGIRSYQMARALIEAGHSVTMICASFAGSSTGLTGSFAHGHRTGTVDGIEVIEFDLSHSNKDSVAARTIKFCRFALRSLIIALRRDYDLVFASSTPLTVAIPGIAARILRRKPFVLEVRDLWPELPRAMGMKNPVLLGGMALLERVSYATADRAIGLAPGIAEGIVRTGKPREEVAMIANGCDFDLFDSVEPTHASDFLRSSVSPDDFVAIFTGAHGRANGLDAVLEAAAVLRERRRSDIKLILVGNGSEKARLQKAARDRGLYNLVFADPVPKTQAAALIKGAGAGLQVLADIPAFHNGTSPNKLFDYLAAGRPILINYPGWLAELIIERNCGLAVPPGHPTAFADALEQFAADPLMCGAMGRASRKLGKDMFDRREQAAKFREVIEDAASAPPRRTA